MGENNKTQKSYYYWIIAICGIMLGVVFMGQANLYSPMAPFIRESLNLSYTQTSMITTIMNLASLSATFLITTIYDNLGVRKGLLIPLVSGVAASLLFCVANNFVMVCIAGFLCQFCFGIGGMMPASLIINRWFVKRKGLILGLCSAGSGVTSMLLSGWVSARVAASGIASAQSIIAILIAVLGILIILFIRNTPEEMGMKPYGEGEEETETKKSNRKKVRLVNTKVLTPKEKILMCSAIVCCGFTGFGAIPNFTMAATSLNFDPVFVGTLVGFIGALAIIGKPLFGFLTDVLGATKANFIYFAAVAIADVLLFVVRPGMEFMLYIIVGIFGMACYSITTIGIPIWAADLSGTEKYSKNLRAFQLCSTGGGLIGAPFAGIIADATGNYGLYYIGMGVCLIYALFMITYMYKTHTKRVNGAE